MINLVSVSNSQSDTWALFHIIQRMTSVTTGCDRAYVAHEALQ